LSALAAALDLEPSSGFEAAVRRRVEADAVARRSLRRRGLLTAGALVVAVVAGGFFTHQTGKGQPLSAVAQTDASLSPELPAVRSEPIAAGEVRPTDAHATRSITQVTLPRKPRHSRVVRPVPPIVLPPGQLEGVRQLASAAASGRLRAGPSLVDWSARVHAEVAPLAAPDVIDVPALEIEPLAN
jgi:hypothetical protein